MKNAQSSKLQTFKIKLQKGYTLFEIMVVIGITSLIFAFGYITYRDFSRRQNLASSGRAFVGQLKLAQEYSLSGKKPDDCTGVLSGYKVSIYESFYSILAVCGNGEKSIDKDEMFFPEGITAAASPSSFTFKVLGQGTDIASSPLMITLTQEVTGNTLQVMVTETGEIQ